MSDRYTIIRQMYEPASYYDGGNWMEDLAVLARLNEQEAEITRLRAIVDKLPKTADGVPVVPGGVYYFGWGHAVARGVATVEASGPELVATVSVMSTLHGHTCKVQVLADNCYSTREAAEAAQHPNGGRDE